MAPKRRQVAENKQVKGKEVASTQGPQDMAHKFGAPFPIFSHEEGKKFLQLKGKPIVTPKHLRFQTLEEVGLKDKIEQLGKKVGWMQFIHFDFVVFEELTLEFFTTVQYDSKTLDEFRFRLRGNPYNLTHNILNTIFGFPKSKTCATHPEFKASNYWKKLTGIDDFDVHNPSNSLIISHAHLVLHKFMCHAVFNKSQSNKCSIKELFLLWCMDTNRKVCTAYHIFHALDQAVTRKHSYIGMGHIITAVAQFYNVNLDGLTPVDVEYFTLMHLRRAEIVAMSSLELRDPNTRATVQQRKRSGSSSPRRPPGNASSSDDSDEEGEGWETVRSTIEDKHKILERRLDSIDDRMKRMEKQQRYHTKKLLKFFEMQGVQVPSPTPSPPSSP